MNIAHYATGLQHIGFPTKDIVGSIRFYTDLGFEKIYETQNEGAGVVFLQLKDLVIEMWEGEPKGVSGSIDHIAIDVTDIEAVFQILTSAGLNAIEGKICNLPFWEKGVRYFMISGPNAEKLEFIQRIK
ncbi:MULTISPECIES: VOC family protein [Agrobacterium]|uniref:VOC family protein n=1 Tax=Agrobacterium TaxID=357 RepID=UPI00191CB3C8|nr:MULTISPECIES: VOC family protein [Agrobacterium]MBN7808903.1 VOC family protein [Agrobacterium rosae]